MEKNNIRIKLTFSDISPASPDEDPAVQLMEELRSASEGRAEEKAEFVTDATYISGERCEIIYTESEELGMGNSRVKVSWLADDPQVVSVMRSGEVETVMTFEPGRRYISAYSLPGMSFELCTHTLRADNSFDGESGGEIYLDYIIEIRGGFAGRRKMKIELLPNVKEIL
jgi:uncharacterized beta-barrel protein YwiB (DUF1934 family)